MKSFTHTKLKRSINIERDGGPDGTCRHVEPDVLDLMSMT